MQNSKKKLLKAAIQYYADVAIWVKAVRKWANSKPESGTEDEEGPGSNPPPPPPPPTGFENP